ncbi:transcription factor TFIIIB subunit brf1 [Paramarasmius palmivorus]|uniref:B-related factor 1 n=1 Tax=Paramarasmius palmivorus TaxID=297713 RepID=A0AAW0CES6_9AGAR
MLPDRTIHNGGRMPLYALGWKLSDEEYNKIVDPVQHPFRNYADFGGAVAVLWKNAGLDKKYTMSRIPRIRDIGIHGWVVYISLNGTTPIPEEFVEDSMQVLQLERRPRWLKPTCTDCGGTVIEYDTAAGNGFCVVCGTVVEENTIVNEVTFGETSSGAAMVQGSYVAQGASHARMGGPYGNRGGGESREQTIANASRKIQTIANVLRLSEVVCMAATRLYTLAVEHKFTKGRKSLNVVAVCLYVACRQKETRNYMLIDFSDLLQVNVFELGHTYLQLVQTLNLRLPLVDPSHYISRFAALLEFGDETSRVATDAVRLVQRFDRDWMTRGRRPAGICGAALLLAARMNNFRRSVEEIVQVVKIADTTLKKRLEEFKGTASAGLTVGDFRSVWLEEEMDPPAYTKGKEKEEAERKERELKEMGIEPDPEPARKRKKKGRGKKRKRDEEEEGVEESEEPAPAIEVAQETTDNTNNIEVPAEAGPSQDRVPIDPTLFNQGILAGTVEVPGAPEDETPEADAEGDLDTEPQHEPLFLPEIEDENIDPELLRVSGQEADSSKTDEFDQVIADEVTAFLSNNEGTQLNDALDERERERLARIQESVVDELLGLDEEELDAFLLNEEEVKIKERVWVELNKDYLEALAAKGDLTNEPKSKSRKKRKTNNKPRDMTTPHGATTAESVRNLIKKNPKYSKRINYDALKDLFVTDNKDDDTELYTMDDKDDKDDGDGMLVVIEEDDAGARPARPPQPEEDEDDKDDDEGRDMGHWDDVYEQEV